MDGLGLVIIFWSANEWIDPAEREPALTTTMLRARRCPGPFVLVRSGIGIIGEGCEPHVPHTTPKMTKLRPQTKARASNRIQDRVR